MLLYKSALVSNHFGEGLWISVNTSPGDLQPLESLDHEGKLKQCETMTNIMKSGNRFIEGIIPPRTFTKTNFCTFIVIEQSVSDFDCNYSISCAIVAITRCVELLEYIKILTANCTEFFMTTYNGDSAIIKAFILHQQEFSNYSRRL